MGHPDVQVETVLAAPRGRLGQSHLQAPLLELRGLQQPCSTQRSVEEHCVSKTFHSITVPSLREDPGDTSQVPGSQHQYKAS